MNWYKRQLKIAMPKRIEWREEDLEAMKELFNEGFSINQVADVTGVSYGAIKKLNNEYQWIPTDRAGRDRKKDEEIAKLYLPHPKGEGLDTQQISQKLNVNYYRIRKAIDRLGLMGEWRDRKTMWNDEMRGRQKDNINRQYEDPEFRQNVLDRINSQEFKEKSKQYHQSPEAREIYDSPEYSDRMSQQALKMWKEKYPGGWDQYINQFPPEKQREIERAMNANKPL